MLLYKIDEPINKILDFAEELEAPTSNKDNQYDNFPYMINLLTIDYNNYFKASDYLQSRYDFSLEAIYSCLCKVNNDTNKTNAYRELSRFLITIKNKSGMCMQIIQQKNSLYVREKPKVKVKKYKRLAS